MNHFRAPWSTTLIVLSTLSTLICIGATYVLWSRLTAAGAGTLRVWLSLLPAVIVGCALFTIRGYSLTHDAILIQRLLWATRVPLAGLKSITFDPNAMRWSIRTFGNGGCFSFSGYFSNRRLGAYRAFVTDPRRTVVLRYSHRTVVVSPDRPEAFVDKISRSLYGN